MTGPIYTRALATYQEASVFKSISVLCKRAAQSISSKDPRLSVCTHIFAYFSMRLTTSAVIAPEHLPHVLTISVRLYPGAETSKHCVCTRLIQQCTISSSRPLVSENARSQMPHFSASWMMMQLPCWKCERIRSSSSDRDRAQIKLTSSSPSQSPPKTSIRARSALLEPQTPFRRPGAEFAGSCKLKCSFRRCGRG